MTVARGGLYAVNLLTYRVDTLPFCLTELPLHGDKWYQSAVQIVLTGLQLTLFYAALAQISCQSNGDNDDNTQYDEPQKVKVGGVTIELYPRCFAFFPWLKTQNTEVGTGIKHSITHESGFGIEPNIGEEEPLVNEFLTTKDVFMHTCLGQSVEDTVANGKELTASVGSQ